MGYFICMSIGVTIGVITMCLFSVNKCNECEYKRRKNERYI